MKPTIHRGLYDAIFTEDDVKWQSLIYALVRSGKIDPWDVDISLFANEYLKMIRKLKELNFRISGKVVLAAAILLKLKTNRLGLTDFLGLIEEPSDEELGLEFSEGEEVFIDEDERRLLKLAEHIRHNTPKKYLLKPKIPTARQRKVTVMELVRALKKAMEVEARREERRAKIENLPKQEYKVKKVNIYEKIRAVIKRIKQFILKTKRNTIEFHYLVPSKKKKDVVWTFIPILHLAQHGKLHLHQDRPFAPILIEVLDKDLEIKRVEE